MVIYFSFFTIQRHLFYLSIVKSLMISGQS